MNTLEYKGKTYELKGLTVQALVDAARENKCAKGHVNKFCNACLGVELVTFGREREVTLTSAVKDFILADPERPLWLIKHGFLVKVEEEVEIGQWYRGDSGELYLGVRLLSKSTTIIPMSRGYEQSTKDSFVGSYITPIPPPTITEAEPGQKPRTAMNCAYLNILVEDICGIDMCRGVTGCKKYEPKS